MGCPCVRAVVCVTCSARNVKVATDHVEVGGCGSVDALSDQVAGRVLVFGLNV